LNRDITEEDVAEASHGSGMAVWAKQVEVEVVECSELVNGQFGGESEDKVVVDVLRGPSASKEADWCLGHS